MKKVKITYWITTGIIVLLDGLLPALTSQTELAKQGIAHLQYPAYFGVILIIFKVIGALTLILPMIKGRYKEWAYAGFGISLICASASHGVIDGMDFQTFFPLIILGILAVSYFCYHRLQPQRSNYPI
jgi:hypothetical protein